MLGLDSNVLVRYFTRDDEGQFVQASRVLETSAPQSLFVSLIVLVEVNWVLQRVYRRSRRDVLETLTSLADSRQVVVEQRDRVLKAIRMATDTRADFSDALIALGNEASDCTRTVTFDVDALDLPQMQAVAEVTR